jgi:hypothetical protein
MTAYVPKCLACEGPVKEAEERVAIAVGRGKHDVRYRHASDGDCRRYLTGYFGGMAALTHGPMIDEPDYTENGRANEYLTDRPVRKGAR